MSKPIVHKGVLTFALGTEYQKQAYCQALTARSSLNLPMTVAVDELTYAPLADVANVIPIGKRWAAFEYEQLALELTPYDVTFKTDADMLFPAGSSVYHPEHLPFSSGTACDCLGNVTYSTMYREVETRLGLPDVYSALFSFDKRHSESVEFFARVKYLFNHWYGLRIWDSAVRKLPPTTDTVYSMAHLHVAGHARIDGNLFVHAKPHINMWTEEAWTSVKNFTVDNRMRMYLDGLRMNIPLHYFDKSLITNEFIERLTHVHSLQNV